MNCDCVRAMSSWRQIGSVSAKSVWPQVVGFCVRLSMAQTDFWMWMQSAQMKWLPSVDSGVSASVTLSVCEWAWRPLRQIQTLPNIAISPNEGATSHCNFTLAVPPLARVSLPTPHFSLPLFPLSLLSLEELSDETFVGHWGLHRHQHCLAMFIYVVFAWCNLQLFALFEYVHRTRVLFVSVSNANWGWLLSLVTFHYVGIKIELSKLKQIILLARNESWTRTWGRVASASSLHYFPLHAHFTYFLFSSKQFRLCGTIKLVRAGVLRETD